MSGKSRQAADARLIELLARGETQTRAATAIGVSSRTVSRRLSEPEFVKELDAVRQQMFDSAAGKVSYLMTEAIDGLQELLKSNTPPATKLSAARAVIDYSLRLNEQMTLARKLGELEEMVTRLQSRR